MSKSKIEFEVFDDSSGERPSGIPDELHYPFRICIVGSTGSGKSNLIKNLVFKFYEKALEKVFYLSAKTATIKQIKNQFEKRKPSFDLETFRKFNNDKLEEIVEELDENETHSVFVVEDLLSANVSKKQSNNVLDKIIQNGRESNINSIISGQRYLDFNPNQRKDNCSLLIILEKLGDKDIKTLADEQKINIKKDQLEQLLDQYASPQFEFLVIDFTEEINKRFKDSKFQPIDLGNDEEDDLGHEVLKGRPKKETRKESKPEGKSKSKSESKAKNTSQDIILEKFDKDGDQIIARFKVGDKEKKVSFKVKPDSYIKSKKLEDRKKFIQSLSKQQRENPNPLDPKVLERWFLNESTSLKDNLEIYLDKFGIKKAKEIKK